MLNLLISNFFLKFQAQWMKEMSEGVPTLDPEALKPDVDPIDDGEYHAINPPTNRDNKKNLKTRRKAREEKMKQVERHLSKIEQKKISDIYRYGSFCFISFLLSHYVLLVITLKTRNLSYSYFNHYCVCHV